MLVSTAAKAALIGCELGLPNVGAYLDFGHALMSRESPAESVALLSRLNRLVGVHVNDNYGSGDDDVTVGSINLWAMLEFLWTLQQVDYEDWISLDIVPQRENVVAASARSIANLNIYQQLLARLDVVQIRQAQAELDALEAQKLVQELLAPTSEPSQAAFGFSASQGRR
jgi:xylose isomerase